MIQPQERMISDEIKKLVPVLGKENAERLNRAYLLGDEKTRKRIFEMVDAVKAAVFSNRELHGSVLLEPPPREVAESGEIVLGNVLYGRKRMFSFSIPKDSLLMHTAIFGSSGYGKTNISYRLADAISSSGTPVVIFDFSKRNYRDLLSTHLKERVSIFTVGRNVSPFRFNPLVPPEGTPVSQWMKEFASIFDHAYWLLGGGRHVILKALDEIYERRDTPRLKDIKEWLDQYATTQLPVRERNWVATAARPLESLCFRELGEVFDCDSGIRPDQLFAPGRITIFELDALDTNDKSFFIEITLQWIRDWLLASGEREKLAGVVILEEAHHVLNREKAKKIGSETVMDLVFREMRELGLGVVYIDQHPSLVSYPALGNTSTHIYMNLGLDTKHSSDIQDASAMLGLRYEDESNYLRKIPVGQGFVLRRGSPFNDPFLVEFMKFPLKKGSVSDADVSEFMKGKLKIETESRHEESGHEIREESKNIPDRELSNSDWRIIETIGQGIGTYSSQIYRSIGISGSTFSKRAESLISLGILGTCDAKIRKNRMKCYFLTPLGEKSFKRSFAEKEARVSMNIDNIIEMFSLAGWKCVRKDDTLECSSKEGKSFSINLVSEHSRKGIERRIRNGETYLCASDGIRNLLTEKAAAFCSRTGKPIVILAATVGEFEKKGMFDRIEFGV